MLNSDRFLDAFSTIEKYTRIAARAKPGDSFTGNVHRAAKYDATIRRYSDILIEYAQLRNAIVHGPRGERVLAEPNDEVVADIERIARLLAEPPPLDRFMNRSVTIMQADEPLLKAIRLFREATFSQIPVYRGKRFVGLLTTTAVVLWFGDHIQNGCVQVDSVRVEEVLGTGGEEKRYLFLPRQSTAFDVLEAFEDYQRRGQRLRAVLVTEHGKPDEGLLGIVTVWDLQAIYGVLGE